MESGGGGGWCTERVGSRNEAAVDTVTRHRAFLLSK
jgi:hypothetical protein